MHMSTSKKWQVNQFEPLLKPWFVAVITNKFIHGWGFKKRKKDFKTFVGLLFANDIYLKQI
jgi:hypothetical protein